MKDMNSSAVEAGPVRELPVKPSLIENQQGKIGYLVAWLLGVPVWVLLIVFLIKG